MDLSDPKSLRRLQVTLGHVNPHLNISQGLNGLQINRENVSSNNYNQFKKKTDEDEQHWNGWGYKDTSFLVNKNGQVELSGDRYLFSGNMLPHFRSWMEKNCGLDINNISLSQSIDDAIAHVPSAIVNGGFMREIRSRKCFSRIHDDAKARLDHAHGHTCQEVYKLRFGRFDRVPDLVIYPGSHEDVESIVSLAQQYNVAVIPFGGGTSVSQALLCSSDERRMIVSLDMKDMNRIKWIDAESQLACIEAGAVGKKLHQELSNRYHLCLGHEPDSFEFSTLGGWISTRASGMKKNVYGNIEDIVVQARLVTPSGTIEKGCRVPRSSTGPDVNHFIMGSEGLLGVVTEAVVKVHPLPPCVEYGSIAFPDFESGVRFMRQVARQRCAPASIRLVDNEQFQFGHALKPEQHSSVGAIVDWFKKMYVTQYHGFDPNKMVVATLLFEGREDDVKIQQQKLYNLAPQFGGIKAGPDNGKRGYFLTYMIAYLRDYGFGFKFIAESFETSVPWSHVLQLCHRVKQRINDAAQENGVVKKPFVSCRVTQTYDTGAAVYFYFGFAWGGLSNPVDVYSRIEDAARDEILANEGCLSHHHGVGKLRKKWMTDAISETGVRALSGLKSSVDPDNIFATGNMGI
eukprot:gb/GECH01002507.1/.p1 GENE.gb/GECH01002507.1/~~gb/GECH01002507.1/.p1  ORF type:complete len:629 (+),score=150.59 gb/GECH01002507.1/:1-1887(+)